MGLGFQVLGPELFLNSGFRCVGRLTLRVLRDESSWLLGQTWWQPRWLAFQDPPRALEWSPYGP